MAQKAPAPARGQPSQLSENEKPVQQIESPKAVEEPRIVPSSCIGPLWDAEDPNAKAQQLFMDFLQVESKNKNEDLNKWDDCEARFEPNEIKWIGNFIVDNLVFCRTKINVTEDSVCSQILHLLWDVLDLFGAHSDLPQHTGDRYKVLQEGLKKMFESKDLSSAQIAQLLEFARQDIFGHMQLYMACIGMQKQQVRVKAINLFQEMPQLCESPNLNTDCKEITDEQPKEAKIDSVVKTDEPCEEEEEKEDIVDPEDPLYGLEQRLKGLSLDEESKRIIKDKLIEASGKIKQGLEQRQSNLDAKLNAAPPSKKK